MTDLDLGARHGERPGFVAAGREGSVPARFAAQVRRHGDRPAVIGETTWSYARLAEAAGGVAHAIPGAVTAILLPHGPETIAAILGVLAAGSAYVPLDPAYPAERLRFMLSDSGAAAVLADASTWSLAKSLCGEQPLIDVSTVEPRPLPQREISPDTVAYVLYTSGSTGVPKGVVHNHRNIVFAASNHINNFRVTPDDRVGVLTSFSFDMAVTDTFSALLSGAAAVPVDVRSQGIGHLADALRERRVTVYHSTPTVYRQLLTTLGEGRLSDIRAVLLGGEDVGVADAAAFWRHFASDGVFVNGYGTTEISFIAQEHLTAAPEGPRVPAGRPLDGVEVILDESGEIVVRSRYLAQGYVGRPFADLGEGVREYRTGDLARRLPDGRLITLGRADRQLKIRGHRVEPAELEAALRELPGVTQAVAAAHDGELYGYVVGPQWIDRHTLSQRLPAQLVPRDVIILGALPMTPTGKVDVAALPRPRAQPRLVPRPRTPIEEVVCAAWAAELGVSGVGPEENVFDLGAHSLLLAGVQRRLEHELAVRVPLVRMLEHPTAAGLSAMLARRGNEAALSDASPGDGASRHGGGDAGAARGGTARGDVHAARDVDEALARMARRRAARGGAA
jgi:amino acid adenylation domain-containing protein